ncbi:MAG: YlxR family protein [Clostridia bacterium]
MPSNPKNTRKCCVCHQHADKSELIRFVKSTDGVEIDRNQKAGGRGVWVHNNEECIQKLIKKRLLNAAFKRNVGDNIYLELTNNDK